MHRGHRDESNCCLKSYDFPDNSDGFKNETIFRHCPFGQNLKFEVIPSTFPENLDKSKFTPSEYVVENAKQKALEVFGSECKQNADHPPDLVIGADTVVVFKGQILEKPKDVEDAKKMLSALSGNTHTVASGVALIDRTQRISTFVQTTTVEMAPISSSMIDAYIETKESFDKAGGYGMQGIAGQFISKIDGCYFNVVGFPLQLFCSELRGFLKLDQEQSSKESISAMSAVTKDQELNTKVNGTDTAPPAKKQKI